MRFAVQGTGGTIELAPTRLVIAGYTFAFLAARLGSLEGLAVFGGTVPLLPGAFRFEPGFEAELHDPATGRSLTCTYRMRARRT